MSNLIMNELQEVFREVFKDAGIVLSAQTSAKDIKMWDSFMHIQLITAVEKRFDIQFSFNEVMQFNQVDDLLKAIETKM